MRASESAIKTQSATVYKCYATIAQQDYSSMMAATGIMEGHNKVVCSTHSFIGVKSGTSFISSPSLIGFNKRVWYSLE